MIDEPLVQQLVQELLNSERTPEEVCAEHPELREEVRKRWQQKLRVVEAQLRALFPAPESKRDADTPPPWNPAAELPGIPGYQVEAVVGRGGMGIVYKARHLRLNRPVALKMLLAGAYAGPEERQRFLREAEAVAGLRHPNIVQVHDIGDHDGRPYFTMECVEGGVLRNGCWGRRSASATRPAWWLPWPMPCRWRIRAGSSTAISSRSASFCSAKPQSPLRTPKSTAVCAGLLTQPPALCASLPTPHRGREAFGRIERRGRETRAERSRTASRRHPFRRQIRIPCRP